MLNGRFFNSRLNLYRGTELVDVLRRTTVDGQHVLTVVISQVEVDHQQRPVIEGEGDTAIVSVSIDVFYFAFGTDVRVNDIVQFNDTEYLVGDVLSEGTTNRRVQVMTEAVPNAI